MTDLTPTSRTATELTLHLLNTPNGTDANAYDLITRLCPRGVYDLLPLALHLAEACGALLERECGNRDAVIEALQRQLAEHDTQPARTDA